MADLFADLDDIAKRLAATDAEIAASPTLGTLGTLGKGPETQAVETKGFGHFGHFGHGSAQENYQAQILTSKNPPQGGPEDAGKGRASSSTFTLPKMPKVPKPIESRDHEKIGVPKTTPEMPKLPKTASDWIAEFEERAAIRQFEGGQTRTVAEAGAFQDVFIGMRPPDGMTLAMKEAADALRRVGLGTGNLSHGGSA